MKSLHLAYEAHIATSVVIADDPYGFFPHTYPFGSARRMPMCDAQDLIHAVFNNGVFPEPCNIPLRFINDCNGKLMVAPNLR